MSILGKYREWKFRRDSRRVARLLKRINSVMILRGWPKWKRQQFWHNFIKHDSVRSQLFDAVGKEFR